MRTALWFIRFTLGVSLLPATAGAALTHRYSFDDGTVDDSVGSANGTLMGGATVSGGQLQFDPTVNDGSNYPTTGQYVSLPTNIIKTRTFSIEVWATERSNNSWQRLLDMSNGPNGAETGTGTGFMLLTPFGYTGEGLFGQVSIASSSGPTTDYVTTFTETPLNRENQYVYTFDPDAGVEYVYENGFSVGEALADLDPSGTLYSDFWIGRSDFTFDPYFDGTIDELRTYDTALPAAQVRADWFAGPEVLASVPEPTPFGIAGAIFVLLGTRRARTLPSKADLA